MDKHGTGWIEMYGMILLGDINRQDLYRLIGAMIIAWNEGVRANVAVGKEISFNINGLEKLKFDVALYMLKKIPIDLKVLIKDEIPKAVIEDSTDLKNLEYRSKRLSHLPTHYGIDAYYLHVRNLVGGDNLLKLVEIDQDSRFFELEVRL